MTYNNRPVNLDEGALNALHHDELYDVRIGGFQDPLAVIKRGQTAQQVKESFNPSHSGIYVAPSCVRSRR